MLRRLTVGLPNLREALLPTSTAPSALYRLSSGVQSGNDAGAFPTTAVPAAPQGLSSVPTTPKLLGLAGVIPFVALSPPIANALPMMPADIVANAALLQLTYGASIASFLGGVHWSLAMVNFTGTKAGQESVADRYIWSVTPCLLAWPAVTMASGPGSFIVASVLGVSYMMDRSFAKRGLLPPWYMVLRKYLTAGAFTGLTVSIIGPFMKEVRQEQPEQPSA